MPGVENFLLTRAARLLNSSASQRFLHLEFEAVSVESLIDLDDLVWLYASLRRDKLVLAREGVTRRFSLGTPSPALLQTVLQDVAEGHTIILNEAEAAHPVLSRLANGMARLTGSRVSANVYITPPRAQGFTRHADAHDVLALQLSGQKEWQVWQTVGSLGPLGDCEQFLLEPGSMLFMPQGVEHAASTSSKHSCHVTFGFQPIAAGDLFQALAPSEVRIATKDSGNRQVELVLSEIAEKLSIKEYPTTIEQAIGAGVLGNLSPPPDGLSYAFDASAAAAAAVFRFRPGTSAQTSDDDPDTVSLSFDGTEIDLQLSPMQREAFLGPDQILTGEVHLEVPAAGFSKVAWRILIDFLVEQRAMVRIENAH